MSAAMKNKANNKNETATRTKAASAGKEREIVALDLGDRRHEVCVLSRRGGRVVERGKVANTREALAGLSGRHRGALVVMEVGMNSPWVSRFFVGLGHRAVVANPRKVRAIYRNDRKSDRKDAEVVGRLARSE